MQSVEGFVAEQLAAWEVPGCAIAAVRDGKVVLAGGWGRRDVAGLLCGTYVMGPIEIVVAPRDDQVLTATTPGAPPFELEPGRGLGFGVKGQPGVTAEFELDESGTVTRLIVQPLGIFRPKTSEGDAA